MSCFWGYWIRWTGLIGYKLYSSTVHYNLNILGHDWSLTTILTIHYMSSQQEGQWARIQLMWYSFRLASEFIQIIKLKGQYWKMFGIYRYRKFRLLMSINQLSISVNILSISINKANYRYRQIYDWLLRRLAVSSGVTNDVADTQKMTKRNVS